MDEFSKYPISIPAHRQNEIIINLLVENLAASNALLVSLSMLNAQIGKKETELFVSVAMKQKEEFLISLIAALEKKYGE